MHMAPNPTAGEGTTVGGNECSGNKSSRTRLSGHSMAQPLWRGRGSPHLIIDHTVFVRALWSTENLHRHLICPYLSGMASLFIHILQKRKLKLGGSQGLREPWLQGAGDRSGGLSGWLIGGLLLEKKGGLALECGRLPPHRNSASRSRSP